MIVWAQSLPELKDKEENEVIKKEKKSRLITLNLKI